MTSAYTANAFGIAATQATAADRTVARRTRLGQFSFINTLPIVLPMLRGEVTVDADVTLESPAQLNRLITEGALDVSAVSSYQYLSRHDLAFIPHVSISCCGPVGSVLLFSKHSLEDLAHADRMLVTSAQSASSVNLLKVLMMEQFGELPLMTSDPTPSIESEGVDAVLVIGDRALEVDTAWSMRYLRIDLGDWWWRTFSLPMVFGLWAARMDWIERMPQGYATISDALRKSKTFGLTTSFDAVLDEAEQRTGLARTRLTHYYQSQLNFELLPSHLEGLKMYQTLAEKHGFLPKV
jgi:chorismate dehydratase